MQTEVWNSGVMEKEQGTATQGGNCLSCQKIMQKFS